MRIIILLCILLFISCSSQMEVIKADFITHQPKFAVDIPESYIQIASNFFEQEKYDSALVYCHKSYPENRQNWKLSFLYGQVAYKMKYNKLATKYYYQALSLCKSENSNRAKIYFALGENEDYLSNLTSAKQHFLMVIQLSPDSILAHKASQKMQLLSSTK